MQVSSFNRFYGSPDIYFYLNFILISSFDFFLMRMHFLLRFLKVYQSKYEKERGVFLRVYCVMQDLASSPLKRIDWKHEKGKSIDPER